MHAGGGSEEFIGDTCRMPRLRLSEELKASIQLLDARQPCMTEAGSNYHTSSDRDADRHTSLPCDKILALGSSASIRKYI